MNILHGILRINANTCRDPYQSLLFAAMLMTPFCALCRIREISDVMHNPLRQNVAFSTDATKIIITFITFKHSLSKHSTTTAKRVARTTNRSLWNRKESPFYIWKSDTIQFFILLAVTSIYKCWVSFDRACTYWTFNTISGVQMILIMNFFISVRLGMLEWFTVIVW